jgi:hypothetical protein
MKSELKKELLKLLKSDMMEEAKSSKADLFKDMMPKKGEKEAMSKVTVMGDSPEAVMEGLSKAEQIMKKKLGMDMKKCPCGKFPCKCEAPEMEESEEEYED